MRIRNAAFDGSVVELAGLTLLVVVLVAFVGVCAAMLVEALARRRARRRARAGRALALDL